MSLTWMIVRRIRVITGVAWMVSLVFRAFVRRVIRVRVARVRWTSVVVSFVVTGVNV